MFQFPRTKRVPKFAHSLEQEDLELLIETGSFTPFLGAGASRVEYYEPNDKGGQVDWWNSVDVRLAQLENAVEESYKLYVRSISEEFRGLVPGDAKAEESPVDYQDNWESLLFDLQINVIRASAEMIVLFGGTLSMSCKCVGDVSSFSVAVENTSRSSLDKITEALCQATDCALELKKSQRSSASRLKTIGVYRALLRLSSDFLHPALRQRNFYAAWTRRHSQGLRILKNPDQEDRVKALSIGSLEWLSQLLWYTLRFRVPSYPTSKELAVELALEANAPPVPGHLTEAAELLIDYSGLVETVQKTLRPADNHEYARFSRFHLAVAAAMEACYQRLVDQYGGRNVTDAWEPRHWPLILTTNFDRALEHAFVHLQIDHHVLYPVFQDSGNNDHTISWVRKNVIWRRQVMKEDHELVDAMNKTTGPLTGLLELHGPILFKLHGSPLDEIPAVEGKNSIHCVVLSESGYLESLLKSDEAFPPWLKRQLWIEDTRSQRHRSLCFLGYSLSDWNVRLRLYEQLQREVGGSDDQANTEGSSAAGQQNEQQSSRSGDLDKVAILRRDASDPFRTAIFGSLRVIAVPDELERIAELLLTCKPVVRADFDLR